MDDDAFRILHVLCRLSEKNADSSDVRSHELRSIILSLDMILLIVQNVQPELLNEQHSFIWVMRAHLCKVSVSKINAGSKPSRLPYSVSCNWYRLLFSGANDARRIACTRGFRSRTLDLRSAREQIQKLSQIAN